MKLTSYNVISSDGFIATKDRNEDFIPDELWGSFLEICNQHDVLIWGKNTYEAFLLYDKDLIIDFLALPIKKVILTRDMDFISQSEFETVHTIAEISNLGENVLLSSSYVLNDLFVQENILDIVIVNVLPIVLREGIPQFTKLPSLSLISEKDYPQWIQRIYALIK
jgi:dihydrofolate reductase